MKIWICLLVAIVIPIVGGVVLWMKIDNLDRDITTVITAVADRVDLHSDILEKSEPKRVRVSTGNGQSVVLEETGTPDRWKFSSDQGN